MNVRRMEVPTNWMSLSERRQLAVGKTDNAERNAWVTVRYIIDSSEISDTAKHFRATNYWVLTYFYPVQVIHRAFKAEYASAFCNI